MFPFSLFPFYFSGNTFFFFTNFLSAVYFHKSCLIGRRSVFTTQGKLDRPSSGWLENVLQQKVFAKRKDELLFHLQLRRGQRNGKLFSLAQFPSVLHPPTRPHHKRGPTWSTMRLIWPLMWEQEEGGRLSASLTIIRWRMTNDELL